MAQTKSNVIDTAISAFFVAGIALSLFLSTLTLLYLVDLLRNDRSTFLEEYENVTNCRPSSWIAQVNHKDPKQNVSDSERDPHPLCRDTFHER